MSPALLSTEESPQEELVWAKARILELESRLTEFENAVAQDWRGVFNALSDALIIHDERGRIMEANERTLLLFEVSRQDLKRFTMRDFYAEVCMVKDEKDADILDPATLKNMALSGRVFRETLLRKPLRQCTFFAEVAMSVISFQGRDATLTTVRDITKRKEVEHSLLNFHTELERANAHRVERLQSIASMLNTEIMQCQAIQDAISESTEHLDTLSTLRTQNGQAERRPQNNMDSLSKRELQVLMHLAQGLRPKEIGQRIGVDPRIVSSYTCRIAKKLGLRNTTQVVKFALESGLGL